MRSPGPLHCHARARSFEQTDWEAIVVLYDALAQLTPSPVVELNRAIAVLRRAAALAPTARERDLLLSRTG